MGLIEKALADLMTSQHETNIRMSALADSLDKTAEQGHKTAEQARKTAEQAHKTAEQTRETAHRTRDVIDQVKKNVSLTGELLEHLGGVAGSVADLSSRVERIEKKLA